MLKFQLETTVITISAKICVQVLGHVAVGGYAFNPYTENWRMTEHMRLFLILNQTVSKIVSWLFASDGG